MDQILLNTIDGNPVSFVGELVSQTEGSVDSGDGVKRKFALKLYTIESGGYVPSIEYMSDGRAERTGCIAEIVDLVKDVENFFYVFIPEELLPDPAGLPREEVEIRRKLLNSLRKTYESLTFAFLDQVEVVTGQGANAQNHAEATERKSGQV